MDLEKQFNDEIEIDIKEILGLLLHRAVMIILAGTIVALVVFLISKLVLVPQYESSTKLYVINRQDEGTTTFTDIQSATQLTNDYMILVTSRTVTEQVINELGLDMTADELAENITVDTPTNTRILEIVVKSNDQYLAKEIADKLAEVSAKNICNIMQIEKVNIVETANIPSKPISPNVMKNTIIGGILGVFLAGIIVVIQFIMNDTILTSADVERYLGLSTLAMIPISEELYDRKSSKKKKKRKLKKAN